MKLLVFQHSDCEHPGRLRKYLRRDGIAWDVVKLHRDARIPSLECYDALWVMGGPMEAWDTEDYPWLITEKAAIKSWVQTLKRPYLGFGLGHHLLAESLDGTCTRLTPPEIGLLGINLTAAGIADPLFKGMAFSQKALQWHPAQIGEPPQDAVILAQSATCGNQAMRVGSNAWSVQYHAEVETETIDDWLKDPAYRFALEISVGKSALAEMQANTAKYLPELVSNSEILYDNFMSTVARHC